MKEIPSLRVDTAEKTCSNYYKKVTNNRFYAFFVRKVGIKRPD